MPLRAGSWRGAPGRLSAEGSEAAGVVDEGAFEDGASVWMRVLIL